MRSLIVKLAVLVLLMGLASQGISYLFIFSFVFDVVANLVSPRVGHSTWM
jgi:hypothetical protein